MRLPGWRCASSFPVFCTRRHEDATRAMDRVNHFAESSIGRLARAAMAAACAIAAAMPARGLAETKTWTAGGTTVTWDDSGNWTPAGPPTSSDDVLRSFFFG